MREGGEREGERRWENRVRREEGGEGGMGDWVREGGIGEGGREEGGRT